MYLHLSNQCTHSSSLAANPTTGQCTPVARVIRMCDASKTKYGQLGAMISWSVIERDPKSARSFTMSCGCSGSTTGSLSHTIRIRNFAERGWKDTKRLSNRVLDHSGAPRSAVLSSMLRVLATQPRRKKELKLAHSH